MLLVVGQVIRAHGVRGEVVVEVRTDDPAERFAVGASLRTEPAHLGPLVVSEVRGHYGRLLVRFDGVSDRDRAQALRGVALCVDSAALSALGDPDEFHDHQLVGLRAVTPAGQPLGEVVRIEHAPASDLLVVRLGDGHQALVPFVRSIVAEVDLSTGRVVLTPPPGLLEL